MSYEHSQLLLRTALSPKGKGGFATRDVLGSLCSHANKAGRCELGIERIAWEISRSIRMVRYGLADLAAWGAISRRKGGQHNVDIYTVNLRWLKAQHEASEARFKIHRNDRKAQRSDTPDRQPIAGLNGAPDRQPISLQTGNPFPPDRQPIAAKESLKKGGKNKRARKGTAEAQGDVASAVPLGQRALTHPARHPAHPQTPIVEDALAHERASLRSGARALLTARPTPAPAPAQHFDIDSWEPDPDQLIKLRAVRPDLDSEVIDEQVTAFRIWARSKNLPIRDAVECTRRAAGFVRLAHTPRRVARAKGSAGAERASSTKPSKATKTARTDQRRTVSMDEAKLNGKRSRAAPRRELSMDDVRRLAEQAGGYAVIFREGDLNRVVLGHPSNTQPGWDTDAHERSAAEAANFLQRAAKGKGKSKADRARRAQELQQLEKLAESAGCSGVVRSGGGKFVVYFPHATAKDRDDLVVLKTAEAATSWLQDRLRRRASGQPS